MPLETGLSALSIFASMRRHFHGEEPVSFDNLSTGSRPQPLNMLSYIDDRVLFYTVGEAAANTVSDIQDIPQLSVNEAKKILSECQIPEETPVIVYETSTGLFYSIEGTRTGFRGDFVMTPLAWKENSNPEEIESIIIEDWQNSTR